MKQIHPTIRSMTIEEAGTLHLFNPGLMMELDSMTLPLNAGTSDHIHTFRDGTHLYVLVVNYRLGYLGVDEVDMEDGALVSTLK